MKKQFLIILITITILTIVSCDRFERDFKPQITIQEFVQIFNTNSTNYLKNNNISAIMNYFSDDYLNNGIIKNDISAYFISINWTQEALINITPYSSAGKLFAYNFNIKDTGNSIDTTWVDYLKFESGKYIWSGNQTQAIENPKQVVLAQAMTALNCPSCPYSEQKLHFLETLYPNSFIFLEYHFFDSLSVYNNFNDERIYYNITSTPMVVFQGQTKIAGGTQASLDLYQPVVESFLNQDAEINIKNLEFTVENNTVTGSVVLNFDQIKTDNLYIHYAIYEKETTAMNYINEPASHVVRARGKHLLENLQNNSQINFELTSTKYLDSDTYLVIWVQRMMNLNSQHENDKIFNAIKQKLY